jgi:hypothetical protein
MALFVGFNIELTKCMSTYIRESSLMRENLPAGGDIGVALLTQNSWINSFLCHSFKGLK